MNNQIDGRMALMERSELQFKVWKIKTPIVLALGSGGPTETRRKARTKKSQRLHKFLVAFSRRQLVIGKVKLSPGSRLTIGRQLPVDAHTHHV